MNKVWLSDMFDIDEDLENCTFCSRLVEKDQTCDICKQCMGYHGCCNCEDWPEEELLENMKETM